MKTIGLWCVLLAAGAVAYAQAGAGKIVRVDPAVNQIVPASAQIEKLAGGFGFTEGPVWMPGGYLLFSDIPNNVINKWTPNGKAVLFRKPSGYDGAGAPAGAFIGSNSALVSPVTIGEGAYVATGSVITENVPEDALVFGRARQVIKEKRAKALREKAAAGKKKGS